MVRRVVSQCVKMGIIECIVVEGKVVGDSVYGDRDGGGGRVRQGVCGEECCEGVGVCVSVCVCVCAVGRWSGCVRVCACARVCCCVPYSPCVVAHPLIICCTVCVFDVYKNTLLSAQSDTL